MLNRPTYYFVYDYEEYREKNGMNIDLFQVMPGCVYRNGSEIIAQISGRPYPAQRLAAYRKKYLPEDLGSSTMKVANLIFEMYGFAD